MTSAVHERLSFQVVQRAEHYKIEKTTLADVLKKISGIFKQSPHLTTNADKVCSVRHIKMLSDIGIREMCLIHSRDCSTEAGAWTLA